MKSVSFLLALLLSSPALALACSCIAIDFESALKLVDGVFRGIVKRRLNNVGQKRVFEVKVQSLFKGCNFKKNDHIIVTTGTNSANCGVELNVNASYSFTGYRATMSNGIKKQLGSSPKKIANAFGVTLCDFITKWDDMKRGDIRLLRAIDNTNCVAKCKVGGECLSDRYCDNGTCKSLNAPCPTEEVDCEWDPCTAATCISPSTCYNNYCGGCNAIFLDPDRTRIC